MKFIKMQGLGNDFLVVNNLDGHYSNLDYAAITPKICDRHFGVGADGIILIEKSEQADCRMRIINSDGSEPEMCGNGIRCLAQFYFENIDAAKPVISVETDRGILL